MKDTILIQDLQVHFRVGVPAAERAQVQRLLISVELAHDFRAAARTDDLAGTIDYFAVCQRIQRLGEGREWRLIETLAEDVAQMILREFRPEAVTVEIKKFILPETRWVAARIRRCAG